MATLELDPVAQANLLGFLAEYKDPKNERKRVKTAPFKITHGLYIFTKHGRRKGFKEFFPSKETIAETSGTSRRAVTEFLKGSEITLFCEVDKKNCRNYRYRLQEWVYEFFEFFWKTGMMKGYRSDYKKWEKTFQKRLQRWLIPQLASGRTLREILLGVMNKNRLKGSDNFGLKGSATTLLKKVNYTKRVDINEDAVHIQQAKELDCVLSDRLGIGEADRAQFFFKNSLSLLKKGALELCFRIEKLGWRPRNAVRALQAILNELKRERAA